ncbi:MAG: helix-turn-helix transcriptional regulator [Clostridia bacterium]|nr:helix-turn-helix transcriptional regulator [Clostridia bacterium]
MNFDIEKFSYRLNVLLDENNMSQTQLARKIGTSNVTICRYLTCDRIPRLDVLTRIAYVFNVSVDYLLGLTNDKNIQISPENSDLNMNLLVRDLFFLSPNYHLAESQIELIKKLLLANEEFILQHKRK